VKLKLIIAVLVVSALVLNTATAQELKVSNVTVVNPNETGCVNITLNWTGSITSVALTITYDASKINYTGNYTTDLSGTVKIVESPKGTIAALIYGTAQSVSGLTNILSLQFEPLVNDGSLVWVNITKYRIKDANLNPISCNVSNGTFKTPDLIGPEITFDKNNTQNLGPILKLNATIRDWSGVDTSTINVTISNDTKRVTLTNGTDYTVTRVGTNPDTVNVSINVNVSKWFTLPITPLIVTVSACDLNTTPNCNSNSAYINVVKAGFYGFEITNGKIVDGEWFVNKSYVNITIGFASVNTSTIEVLLDNKQLKNETDYDVIGTRIYINITNLTDGLHWINVSGKLTDGSSCSLNESFIVDTQRPNITFFKVVDSDGDGYIERCETLTAYWNVQDANFYKVEVIYGNQVVCELNQSNSSCNFEIPEPGQYIELVASDKAGNTNESVQKFYVYNNYIAYIERNKSVNILGMMFSKTATLDLMNTNIVKITLKNGVPIGVPVNTIERDVEGNIYTYTRNDTLYTVRVDNNAKTVITSTNFYTDYYVYNSPTTLDFTVKTNPPVSATLLLLKLNSSYVNVSNIIDTLKELNFSDTRYIEEAYVLSPNGWANFTIQPDGKISTPIHKEPSNFVLVVGTLKDVINAYKANLGNFDLAQTYASKNITPPKLNSGVYVLVALTIDNDVLGLCGAMPIVVLNNPEQPNYPASIVRGDTVKVQFPTDVDRTFAILVKDVKYDVYIHTNFSEGLLSSGKVEIKYDSASLKEFSVTYKDKTYTTSKILVPEGYFAWKYTKANYTEIDTSNLTVGTYKLYIIAERDKLPYYIGVATVELKAPVVTTTTTVTPAPAVGGGAGGGGYVVSAPSITGQAVATYSSVTTATANTPLTITLPSTYVEQTNVLKVTIIPAESGMVQIVVAKVIPPSNVPRPSYPVYTYFDIGASGVTVKSGVVEFRVSRSWIKEHNAKPENVILLHYKNGAWMEEKTEKIREDANYYYYKATFSSMSLFAVAVKPTVPTTVTTTVPTTVVTTTAVATTTVPPTTTVPAKPPQIPWMWIGVAIVIVVIAIAIGYYATRRR